MHEVGAEPPDHRARSAGLETDEACQRTSHSLQHWGKVVGEAQDPCLSLYPTLLHYFGAHPAPYTRLPHLCLLRGPQVGGIATTLAFLGVPSKGDKIKSGCIGGKDKTVDMQPNEYHQKKFSHKWCACIEKHPQTPPPPPQTILKKGSVFRNPSWYRISENPPPPPPMVG